MAKSKINTYTRSSTVSLKFTNKDKRNLLRKLVTEYNRLLNLFIQYFWVQKPESLCKFAGKDVYNLYDSFLGAKIKQNAAKQALGIVKGTWAKQQKRIFVYEKLTKEGDTKGAAKLKKKIDEAKMSCPTFDKPVPIVLDKQSAKIQLNTETTFDGWIKFVLGDRKSFLIPFRRTKHFNKKLKECSKFCSGIRLDLNSITFTFEFEAKTKTDGATMGIDIGKKKVITASNGFLGNEKLNGHNYDSICTRMSKQKKGSKAFARTQELRTNYINWSINQLNLTDVKTVVREDIKDIKKGKYINRTMQAWCYPIIFAKLERYCEEQNVSVITVPPAYTSQRCSVCGWTHSDNRKGEEFRCTHCGHTEDADFNASKNLSLMPDLLKPSWVRRGTGFQWDACVGSL
jgi:IS605 OrfB family transposase